MSAPLTSTDRRGDELPIGRFTWLDADGNELHDIGNVAVAGVVVSLRDGSGAEVARTVTDRSGNYRFDDLPMGHYSVVFTAPRTAVAEPRDRTRLQLDDLDQLRVPVSSHERCAATPVQTWTVSHSGWHDRTSVLQVAGSLG
jgi:hypothetical protein